LTQIEEVEQEYLKCQASRTPAAVKKYLEYQMAININTDPTQFKEINHIDIFF